jgi:hypothetical protein
MMTKYKITAIYPSDRDKAIRIILSADKNAKILKLNNSYTFTFKSFLNLSEVTKKVVLSDELYSTVKIKKCFIQ